MAKNKLIYGKPKVMWIWLAMAMLFDFVIQPILLFSDALCGIAVVGSVGLFTLLALPCWAYPAILGIIWITFRFWFKNQIKISNPTVMYMSMILTFIIESVPFFRILPIFTIETLLLMWLHER